MIGASLPLAAGTAPIVAPSTYICGSTPIGDDAALGATLAIATTQAEVNAVANGAEPAAGTAWNYTAPLGTVAQVQALYYINTTAAGGRAWFRINKSKLPAPFLGKTAPATPAPADIKCAIITAL
jgi:hypothetical protein